MMISREGERGANGKREHHLVLNLVGAAARKRQAGRVGGGGGSGNGGEGEIRGDGKSTGK